MNDITTPQKWDRLKRPSVDYMDDKLGIPFPVLDKGFIRIIDYMGDEAAICQAARVSYGKGTKSVSEDRGLLRYLLRHWHTTPFEMCEIKLHVKLPVFVARQWIRHRTANVNEHSARYSILANEFFFPDAADIEAQSKTNHQGRGGELPEEMRFGMTDTIEQVSEMAFDTYEEMLTGWPWVDDTGELWEDSGDAHPHDKKLGMARELARMVLPTNIYTEWYWKVDAHNLLHFLRLRADPHAQREIRVYAEVICQIFENWMPNVWEAFVDYQLEAVSFSRAEIENLLLLVDKDRAAQQFVHPSMSRGEHKEYLKKLGVQDAE